MAAITSMLVGAAVVGAGAAYSARQQRKAADQQASAIRRQQEEATVQANNRESLRDTLDETGAKVRLGADERTDGPIAAATQKGTAKGRKKVASIGGVSASKSLIGGL